jgi:hypothetical protein
MAGCLTRIFGATDVPFDTPGCERGGAPRARGGVALTPVILPVLLLRSPNGKQDEGEQNDAENDSRDPGPLRKGSACSP